MADSDASPQRDDCHHRRSRSPSPVSPLWAGGETRAEREERRLAEAAVPVGLPAGQPRAASVDTGLSTREPEAAEVTAAPTASPAARVRSGRTSGAGAAPPRPPRRPLRNNTPPSRSRDGGRTPGQDPP